MDNFKMMYQILRALERALDFDEFDMSEISHERLGISRNRWEQIIIMLAKEGYIEGVLFSKSMSDGRFHVASPIQPMITLKGLEYLSENTFMAKAARCAKGIADIIP